MQSKEQRAWVAACAGARYRPDPDKIHPKPLGARYWVGHTCHQPSPDKRHSPADGAVWGMSMRCMGTSQTYQRDSAHTAV